MAKESLFEILKRSPWWMSLGVAIAIAGAAQVFLPVAYMVFGMFAALPFLVIAIYVAWRERGVPGEAKTQKILETVRGLGWEEFSALVQSAYERDGYVVSPHDGGAADFELRKGARDTLLACRRWKTAQTGIGPLRELRQLKDKTESRACAYLTAGEISATARQFAAQKAIELVEGAALAKLLAPALKRRKA